jgi:hypothetical protein
MNPTYNGHGAFGLQQGMKTLKKFKRKEINRFGSTGEYIVDDIVVRSGSRFGKLRGVADRILQHGRVVFFQIKIFGCKLIHHWIHFHDGCVDAMGDKGRRSRSHPESAVKTS